MYRLYFHSDGIGSRTLVLLLVFDFSPSNVQPSPSRQERHPVVWKYDLSFSIVYFQSLNPCQDYKIWQRSLLLYDPRGYVYKSVCRSPLWVFGGQVYLPFYRLAFTKAERLLPTKNEERWILSSEPKLVQGVNVSIDPGDGISLYASSIPQAK